METSNYHVEVVKGLVQYRYRIVAANGQVLSVSQRYFSKANALRAARKICNEMYWELVVK